MTNAVREVLYRVFYDDDVATGGHYVIKGITADFYLDARLDIDQEFCQSGLDADFLITQKFGMDFIVTR